MLLHPGIPTIQLWDTYGCRGTHTVGYGSSALVFGPQFGNFHGATVRHTALTPQPSRPPTQ